MNNLKLISGFSARIINGGADVPISSGSTPFGCKLLRMDIDLAGDDSWNGIEINCSDASGISGDIVSVSIDVYYKWRTVRNDTWSVQTPWGRFPSDREAMTKYASFANKTLEAYAADNGIDFSKPDIPAQTGAGQQFYAELVSGGTVVDAYFLGNSENLGFDDADEFGFYGKKQVIFYISDTKNTDLSNLSVRLYIGKPGDSYCGPVFISSWLLQSISAENLPPEFVTAKFTRLEPVRAATAVSPIDSKLITSGIDALSYLGGIAKSGYIAYGIQNYPYEKGGIDFKGAREHTSDMLDLTGTNPAIFGLDSLSLIGMEDAWRMPAIAPAVADVTDPSNIPAFIEGTALRSIEAWESGIISTLSLHMSDPGMVYDQFKKNNKNPVTGRAIFTDGEKYKWNFYGYGYGNSTRTRKDSRDGRERSEHNTMLRMYRAINKSGEEYDNGVLEVYNSYLDLVADYCLILQSKNIPILLRPFHENSGDWFWWGNSGCENDDGTYNPEIFKRAWAYTVEYLYNRGVHNCIYVYSPNGPDFDNEEKLGTAAFRPYAITYPGDEWVDICAYDDYTTNEDIMTADIRYVTTFAAEHSKIAAASEITGSPIDPAITEYLVRTLTNTAHLPCNLAYFAQWTPPSFAPYLTSPTRANSGAVNVFIKELNNPKIITADRTCGFKPAK